MCNFSLLNQNFKIYTLYSHTQQEQTSYSSQKFNQESSWFSIANNILNCKVGRLWKIKQLLKILVLFLYTNFLRNFFFLIYYILGWSQNLATFIYFASSSFLQQLLLWNPKTNFSFLNVYYSVFFQVLLWVPNAADDPLGLNQITEKIVGMLRYMALQIMLIVLISTRCSFQPQT